MSSQRSFHRTAMVDHQQRAVLDGNERLLADQPIADPAILSEDQGCLAEGPMDALGRHTFSIRTPRQQRESITGLTPDGERLVLEIEDVLATGDNLGRYAGHFCCGEQGDIPQAMIDPCARGGQQQD